MKGVRLGRTGELFLAESVRLTLFDDQRHDDMEKKKLLWRLLLISFPLYNYVWVEKRRSYNHNHLCNLKLALQLIACLTVESKKS